MNEKGIKILPNYYKQIEELHYSYGGYGGHEVDLFELLGRSLTHGCLLIYGFILPSHKTCYNSFSVIGEDLIKLFFFVFLCAWCFKKWNAHCNDYFIFQSTLFKSMLGNY